MKDSVYICAASLCCCLIVCALVRTIAPTGSTNKIMSVVISVFTLCCLFSPIVNLVKDFDVSAYETEENLHSKEITEAYDASVLKETAQYLSEYITTLLETAKIEVKQVKTTVTANDDRGIYVSSVDIYLYEVTSEQRGNIENLIYDEFRIKPKIQESKYGE